MHKAAVPGDARAPPQLARLLPLRGVLPVPKTGSGAVWAKTVLVSETLDAQTMAAAEAGASVLLLNAVGALICAWATLVTDGHAPFWLLGGQTNAQLWLCWLRLFWGFALWHCTIAVRLHAMGQLYIHDAEPLFWPIKLLQYLAPWLLTCILMTTTQDPPFAMSTAVIVLCFFSFLLSSFISFLTAFPSRIITAQ